MEQGWVGREAVIVSAVCFVRQSLAEIFGRVAGIRVRTQAATLADALGSAGLLSGALVLLDAAFPEGIGAARRLSVELPEASLIVFGVAETEAEVLRWAEAGVTGYVPDSATIDDLIALICQICRGEQSCPSRISASLLRRIATICRSAPLPATRETALLTVREREVVRLMGAGLSNKDIARRLGISLGTTKSHVHNVLGKLGVQRRIELVSEASGVF